MSERLTVLEIDQWSQTGNIEDFEFSELREIIESCEDDEVPNIEGGDAEAARALFGGRFDVKEVDPDEDPSKGYVWFTEGDDDEIEEYKHNYATT